MLRGLVVACACSWLVVSCGWAETTTARLRIAWGSGDGAKHRWFGTMTCADATFSHLQPLGIEADASSAIQLLENRVLVNPLQKRGFDGFDVTITADTESVFRIELRADQSKTPTIVEVPLAEIIKGQVRKPIDSLESFILAYRCPGDRFRLVSPRDHLIFLPGEDWPLEVLVDFAEELKTGPVVVEARLQDSATGQVFWQVSRTLTAESPIDEPLQFEVVCPQAEGGYRLSLSARPEESFTTRLVPGQKAKPYATREIDLVVVDPEAKLPPLTDHWIPILSVDPANPSWWQRLPSWAQVTRLSGKASGSYGNVRLVSREGNPYGLVELPPSTEPSDPPWQAFTLPVLEVGIPHLVEIAYPDNLRQHIEISIIEPDAAGRVNSLIQASGLFVDEVITENEMKLETHRIVFWPRTRSPQLLIANRHVSLPGVFGKITLSRHDDATSVLANQTEKKVSTDRLLAGYISRPTFAENFGAAEVLDPSSGMSVQSWSTFLEGARRLTQFLHLSGYNGVFASVVADGSTLYPSELLLPSPRYDTGLLAASGQDPVRKDVLELLLRICDREHVRLHPALRLNLALPRLEAMRYTASPQVSGITCVDHTGREYRDADFQADGLEMGYNLLNEQVQQEILAVVEQLAEKARGHVAFSGIGLQLSSNGFAMLPGLEWGLDDTTCAAFTKATGIEVPTEGENRFRERAAILLGQAQQVWQAWRVERITRFYRELAERVRRHHPQAEVFLLTEELFAAPTMRQAIRQNLSNSNRLRELLAQRGIDLNQLAAIPGVQVTSCYQEVPREGLQERLSSVVLNELAMKGELLATEFRTTDQHFHAINLSHLSSYDAQSPYGKEMTHLVLAHQSLPAGLSRDYHFTGAFASRPLPNVVVGGDFLPLTLDQQRRSLLATIEQLPRSYLNKQTLEKQPLHLRIQRTDEDTYIVCINESPWIVQAEVEIELESTSGWELLGINGFAVGDSESFSSGILPAGKTTWKIEVPSHGMRAWKFAIPQLEVNQLRIIEDGVIEGYLEQRIAAIQDRTSNLNIVRDYRQLQNPGFELEEGTTRIFGWQIRKGPLGSVVVDKSTARSGKQALRLTSEDSVGVAAQSHLFPIPPTGQLVLGAYLHAIHVESDARIIMAVESEDDGRTYRRFKNLTAADLSNGKWSRCELSLSDLPVGSGDQIRVQFHTLGKADILLDDVDLYDLRFDEQHRSELVKRVYAAKTALEDHQVVDCLRLVNQYWSRYLVEYVPPVEREPIVIAKQSVSTKEPPEEGRQKVGSRLRKFVPKIWR